MSSAALGAPALREATTSASAECAHCGLPVPRGLLAPGQTLQFCCSACRTVYQTIHAEGLGAYYELRDRRPEERAKAAPSAFSEMDEAAWRERAGRARPDGLYEADLLLEGLHCAACVWLVERTLAQVPGVREGRLDFVRRRVHVVLDPETAALSALCARLARVGYVPHPLARGREDVRRREERSMLTRIGVAGAVAGNVMLIAFALYGGWFGGMAREFEVFFRWASLVVSLPSMLYAAVPFYRGAWGGLRAGVLHMDLPISLGVLVGFASGIVNTIRGSGEIYFDSVATLVFLLLVGRWLQLRQQRRAAEASELIFAPAPASARRWQEGAFRVVPAASLEAGDRVEVRPGERIPADAVVEEGASSVDQSLLSGEPKPVPVAPGDVVFGGTTNLELRLVVRLTESLAASRVGRLTELVEEAGRSRAPVVTLADRIASVFIVAILGLSVVTFVAWSFIDAGRAVDHVIALLIVTCPCALGLATPLAITAAIGKAARRGILVRSGSAVETLGRLRSGVVYFDKTGTLTFGRMVLVDWLGPAWAQPLVGAAEEGLAHPVGVALRKALHPGDEPPPVEAREVVPGGGLRARVMGRALSVGAPRFVTADGRSAPSELLAKTEAWTAEGLTPIWVAVDGVVVAGAAVGDTLRPDAALALAALRARGLEVRLLSGDHARAVRAIGAKLGLEPEHCLGDQSPEAKLEVIARSSEATPTIMVGDGVNDAAALARATVGIAVSGGAETALAAADVFIDRPDVSRVVSLIHGAERTVRTIRGNVIFSLFYNLIGGGLAVAGLLNPLLAALLMPFSSLTVVSNSFRFDFGGE